MWLLNLYCTGHLFWCKERGRDTDFVLFPMFGQLSQSHIFKKIYLKIKFEILPLSYAKFFYLWVYVSLFMDCLWLSIDLSLCSWSSTKYFILWLYHVFSYLERLVLLLPSLICFKNFLAILKCLLFFYMNFTVNWSTFNRNSGWYFYWDHVVFIELFRENWHVDKIVAPYPRAGCAFHLSLRSRFKAFFCMDCAHFLCASS